MNWYYSIAGKKHGPVSWEELGALVANNTIKSNVFVWASGMDGWYPYYQVRDAYAEQEAEAQDAGAPKAAEATTAVAPLEETTTAVENQPIESPAEDQPAAPAASLQPAPAPAAGGVRLRVSGQPPDVPPPATAPAAPTSEAPPVIAESEDLSACGGCGAVMPRASLAELGGTLFCGNCHKTTARQMVWDQRMSAAVQAGFWIRVLSRIIDNIVVFVAMVFVSFLSALITGIKLATGQDPTQTKVSPVMAIIVLLVPLLYFTLMHGFWGATLGKLALRLRVVTARRQKIGVFRALWRIAAELINYLAGWALFLLFAKYVLAKMMESNPLVAWIIMLVALIPVVFMGYFWVAFSDEKRGWHDIMAGTRVVRI